MALQKYIFVFIMMNNQKFSCDKGNYKNYRGRDWAGVGAGTRGGRSPAGTGCGLLAHPGWLRGFRGQERVGVGGPMFPL